MKWPTATAFWEVRLRGKSRKIAAQMLLKATGGRVIAIARAAFATACLIVPSSAFASDVAKDVILSTLPPPATDEQKIGRQQLAALIDRIAEVPDTEIPEYPMATNEYGVGMLNRALESTNFCEQARLDFSQRGSETIAAEMTNAFIVAMAEGAQLTGINPQTEEMVPTQEMILGHRIITKMFECM